ncbi:MAG: YbgC/FadM family acyl-CoA thioesterase [Campylobacterota bacterium]|nr:YbgC/FadM family acyl-CoA thioesterase [Campylobacterota bacterium]
MKIRVYYEDTDIGGIVYHSKYLNFCERARSEYFFKNGSTPILENGHFVVRHLDANFLRSATLGDELEVKSEVVAFKAASFTLLQSIYLKEQKVFDMRVKLAFLTHNNSVQKIDESTKEVLLTIFKD